MEFLGDAILQLVTSDHVYKSFPAHHEGHLTVSSRQRSLFPDGAVQLGLMQTLLGLPCIGRRSEWL